MGPRQSSTSWRLFLSDLLNRANVTCPANLTVVVGSDSFLLHVLTKQLPSTYDKGWKAEGQTMGILKRPDSSAGDTVKPDRM